jgi:hypothetical protein
MKEKFEEIEGSSEEEEDDDDVPVRRTGFRMVTQTVGGASIQQQQGMTFKLCVD